MQKILMTGAQGFIGSQFCKRLVASDLELHAVSRHPPTDLASWWRSIGGDMKDVSRASHIHWWNLDLINLEKTRELVRSVRPDHTFHLASLVTGSRSREMVLPTLQNNFLTSVNLLLATTEADVGRIVLAGSMEDANHVNPVPCSPYAAAKRAASDYARMFATLYRADVVVARIAMVYGPGQRDLTKLIPYVITAFLSGERPKLSSGNRLVDWIYVDDVVEGLIASGQASGMSGRSVDIGSGEERSIGAIVEELKRLIPNAPEPLFGAIPDRVLDSSWKVDAAASEELIGWKAATSLEVGLSHTVNWYTSHSGA